ncbi:MAG: hypothetical protein JWO12_1732 [Frankiales bacterium]|nr:hypothetical protein [Frankiales bacterium]
MTAKNLQDDLKADLLADLAPVDASPAPPVDPVPVAPPPVDSTPVVSVAWTPLRWSRPRVVRAKDGVGKAVRLGPLAVELSVKD